MAGFRVGHLPLPGGAPAPKKEGSLSPLSSLPCGAPGQAQTRWTLPCHGCRSRRGDPVPIRFQ